MEQTPPNDKAEAQAAASNVRDRLMDDLQHIISETEKWLEESADAADASETKTRFDDALRTAKNDLHKLEDSFLAHTRDVAEGVNIYVQDNPWKAVGIGAAVGVVIGMLLSRK